MAFGTLIHWGRVTHICVGDLTIIGSDNGLSPGRREAIIWTNAEILLIGPLGTNLWNFNPNSYIFFQGNAFETVVCEMAAILSRPQCVKQTRGPKRYRTRKNLLSQDSHSYEAQYLRNSEKILMIWEMLTMTFFAKWLTKIHQNW